MLLGFFSKFQLRQISEQIPHALAERRVTSHRAIFLYFLWIVKYFDIVVANNDCLYIFIQADHRQQNVILTEVRL